MTAASTTSPPPSPKSYVTVLFFASAREAAGNVSEWRMPLPEAAEAAFDTAQFRTALAAKFPGLASFLSDDESVTLAVNEEYVAPGQVITLRHGDTVALIPPISGG